MAAISSLHFLSQRLCNCFFSFRNKERFRVSRPSISLGIRRCRKQCVLCCDEHRQEAHEHEQESFFWLGELSSGTGTKRREALFKAALTAFTFPTVVSIALAETDVAENFRVYTDDVNKFQISIPQDWRVGAGEPTGFKSVTAFYPDEASTSNVSVVISGLGPDFTKMESFGKVEAFAETLVGGLDRSWQRPPGVAAKLLDSKSANGFYYIEYTLQNPGESRKHVFSALGMSFNGWYNRLYTVTGQYVDEESAKYGPKIQKVASAEQIKQHCTLLHYEYSSYS